MRKRTAISHRLSPPVTKEVKNFFLKYLVFSQIYFENLEKTMFLSFSVRLL